MCFIFAVVEQRCGRKANCLCPVLSMSHGASWTLFAGSELAGKPSQGCWRGGFRYVGSRNEVRHGGMRRTGSDIVRNSLRVLDDFLTATEKKGSPRSEIPSSVVWKPPPPGVFKVNVDGALFSKTKQAGVGVLVRDEEGNVIAALARKLECPLALEIVGLRDVVFEGDSLLVINAVQGINEAEASVRNIILGVLRNVQRFRTFDFLHTKRQGNAPAHLLAQHALNFEKMVVWLEDCPSQVAHAYAQDVLAFRGSN
ncbi:hypothetical protein CFP56_024052 [Quercus suber]|uniref:RNase H type-1 domain-containing protein n=1 Tax=Quercus suber TaxID=58331 RepID=A0AAW0K7X4_QUESU